MRKLILIITLICSTQGLVAQSSSVKYTQVQSSIVKYTQVIISDELTADIAKGITDTFFANSAVETSRMDPTTNVFLCIYDESNEFNELEIISWFGNNGYTVDCYYTDEFGKGNFIDIKDTNCN